jgi:MSHA pilin protein MshC
MIELVVVLILLSIVSAVVAFRPTTISNELVAETETLKSHLRYAQIKAMNDTVPWGIHIPDASSYILYKNNAAATGSNILPGETGQTHNLSSLVSVTAGTGITYNFDTWGSPGATTLTITLSQGSETSSITITKSTGYIP